MLLQDDPEPVADGAECAGGDIDLSGSAIVAAKFGTSGLRGLAEELIGDTTLRYVTAFATHLRQGAGIMPGQAVCVGWDFRDSSPRIVSDVMSALASRGLVGRLCGHVPTPGAGAQGHVTG